MSLITVAPLDTPFTRNDLTVTNNVTNKFKNGTYVISSSSYSSTNNLAYNAFNATTTGYWESGSTKPGSNPVYVQDPYTNSSPASYVGGGVPTTTFKTKVGTSTIGGEWLQIKIPYKIFIDSYSILPRQDANSNQFPKKFYLLGSNDGNKWEIVDQQVNPKPSDDTKKPTQFSVTTIYSYTYFRFIISEMYKGSSASICQLNLFGYLNLISNNVYLDNGVVYSSGGSVFYNAPSGGSVYADGSTVTSSSTNLYSNNGTVNSSGTNTINAENGTVNASQSTVNSSGAPVSATSSTLNGVMGSVIATGGTISTAGSVSSNGGTINANGSTVSSINDTVYSTNGAITNNGGSVYQTATPVPTSSTRTPSTPTPVSRTIPSIKNGDFSQPNISPWTRKQFYGTNLVPNWTMQASILKKEANSYNTNYTQCVAIESSSQFISQTITLSQGKCMLTLSACGKKKLQWLGFRVVNSFSYNPVKILLNNQQIGVIGINNNSGSWTTISIPFTVPSNGNYELKFMGSNNSGTAITNITLSNVEGFTTMNENNSSQYNIKPFSMLDQQYSSFSLTENFTSGIFVPTDALKTTYGGNTQTPEYIDAIKEYQLTPLNNLIKETGDIHGNINLAHQQLGEKTGDAIHLRNRLMYDKRSDYRGDAPLYKDRKPTLADGLQDDVNIMIIKENNLYILGTITLATLLIGTIVVARN